MSVVVSLLPTVSLLLVVYLGLAADLTWLRGWAYTRCHEQDDWKKRALVQAVAISPMIICLTLYWVFIYRFPWPVLPILFLTGAVVRASSSGLTGRSIGVPACGKCGYERPDARDGVNECCPECGNLWWEPPLFGITRRGDRKSRFGIRKFRSERDRRLAILVSTGTIVAVLLLIGLFVVRNTVNSDRMSSLFTPGPVILAMIDRFGDAEQRAEIVGNRIRVGVGAGRNVDDEIEKFMEIRLLKGYIPPDVSDSIEAAIERGLVSKEVLDRFYSEAMEWTLAASLNAAATEVTPELDLIAYDDTNLMGPYVITAGVRINDEPFVQSSEEFSQPSDYANTFADWGTLWPHGAYDNHLNRAQYMTHRSFGFNWVDITHLPPGDHTLSVRFLFYVRGEHISAGFPRLVDAGEFVIPEDLVWFEIRDVTTTFTIP